MHQLTANYQWSEQIARIRNAHSDETGLIRFDNTFYRICKDSTQTFRILLSSGDGAGSPPLQLEVSEKDFYISEIAGGQMERYASTFRSAKISAGTLTSAIHGLAKCNARGEDLFFLKSLIVFCVAESIRNDQFATALDQCLRADQMYIGGVEKEMEIMHWWDLSHQWGKTSEAIHRLNTAKHQHVDLGKIPLQFHQCAKTIRVLKSR